MKKFILITLVSVLSTVAFATENPQITRLSNKRYVVTVTLPGDREVVKATCHKGDELITGGCYSGAGYDVYVSASGVVVESSFDESWLCGFMTVKKPQDWRYVFITANAVCRSQ